MRLVFLNLFRNKISTLLTMFGIAIAIFLFCILETVLWSFTAGVEAADVSRLVVRHKESLVFPLPYSYVNKAKVDGVLSISYGNWFGGVFEPDDKFFFAQFAIDMESYVPLYPEMKIPPEDFQSVLKDRRGCILGQRLADRLKKKVGDTLVLKGGIYFSQDDGNNWEFTVRAIYTSDRPNFDQTIMFFHWNYLNEGWRAPESQKNLVGYLVLKIDDPAKTAEISKAIDKKFSTESERTLTMTEKAFNLEFVSMMGNLSLLIRFFGTVVVFTILLLSINTNMMNARERIGEIGLLKALGFSPRYIFKLYLSESLLLSFIGGLGGLAIAFLLINIMGWNPKPTFFSLFSVQPTTLVIGVLLSLFTGLISGITPAIVSSRMSASEALRSV
ncbi:MAG: FtsX-like permease family protein [Planctomycetota bacterium]